MHVLPVLGSVQLRHIDAGMLNALYASLLADRRKNYAGGGLSPRSVQYVHAIIHRALRDAVKWGRLARNPAEAADPPKAASRPESATWTADELRTFLERTRTSRFAAAYHLIATTGMRRNEARTLHWGDIDLAQRRITLRNPKGAKLARKGATTETVSATERVTEIIWPPPASTTTTSAPDVARLPSRPGSSPEPLR